MVVVVVAIGRGRDCSLFQTELANRIPTMPTTAARDGAREWDQCEGESRILLAFCASEWRRVRQWEASAAMRRAGTEGVFGSLDYGWQLHKVSVRMCTTARL